jgi:hypothetical protein
MILDRVLFGNRMTMSVIVICMPDMQLKEGVLRLFVMLEPCTFAASYPPRTSDPSNRAFEVAPSSPHQYPYDLELMWPASLRADSNVELGPRPMAP